MKCMNKLFFLFFLIFICSCGKNSEKVKNIEIRNKISDIIFMPDLFINYYNEFKKTELINNTRGDNFSLCMVGLETHRQSNRAYFAFDLIKKLFGEPDYFRKGKKEGVNMWMYTYNNGLKNNLSAVILLEYDGIIMEIGFNSYDDKNILKNQNWKEKVKK